MCKKFGLCHKGGFIALGESKSDSANIISVLLMSKSLIVLEDWLHEENLKISSEVHQTDVKHPTCHPIIKSGHTDGALDIIEGGYNVFVAKYPDTDWEVRLQYCNLYPPRNI